jgi:hypothetical protein
VTPTAIAAAVPRRRTKVAGRVTDIACFARPGIRFDAKLSDDTGTVTLRFLGRSQIPGFVVGRLLIAEGTPARTRGVLVILNPLYEFQS